MIFAYVICFYYLPWVGHFCSLFEFLNSRDVIRAAMSASAMGIRAKSLKVLEETAKSLLKTFHPFQRNVTGCQKSLLASTCILLLYLLTKQSAGKKCVQVYLTPASIISRREWIGVLLVAIWFDFDNSLPS